MLQSDTLVNDYFNADHHQLQNTLGKKRSFSEMDMPSSDSVPAINHHEHHHRQPNMHHQDSDESSVFAHDADSFMNKRQKIDRQALPPPAVEDDIYVPEELNINAPQQDMNSILDALENTRNTNSLDAVPAQHVNMGDFITQEMNMDNYPPPFLSDADPFSDDNGM